MPRLHLVADVIKSLWRINTELASKVKRCEQYRKSPLPASFGFCRKIYCGRGLAFGDDENVGSTRKFFQNFLNLFQANIKKRRHDASSDWLYNSFPNRLLLLNIVLHHKVFLQLS